MLPSGTTLLVGGRVVQALTPRGKPLAGEVIEDTGLFSSFDRFAILPNGRLLGACTTGRSAFEVNRVGTISALKRPVPRREEPLHLLPLETGHLALVSDLKTIEEIDQNGRRLWSCPARGACRAIARQGNGNVFVYCEEIGATRIVEVTPGGNCVGQFFPDKGEPFGIVCPRVRVGFDGPVIRNPESRALDAHLRGLSSNDVFTRRRAARNLAALGPLPPEALTRMISACSVDDCIMQNSIAGAVFRSKTAIPSLIQGLDHKHARVRLLCATVLAYFGGDGERAVPKLIDRLRDSDAAVRARAAHTLGNIGPKAAPAVPYLVKLLAKSQPRAVQDCAMRGLGFIGHPARPAIPAVVQMLKGADEDRAYDVLWVLGLIKEGTPLAVATLREHLSADKPLRVRVAAASSLGHLGPAAHEAIPDLVASIRRDARKGKGIDNTILCEAIEALGAMRVHSKSVIQVLAEIVSNDGLPATPRVAAARALGLLGARTSVVIRCLTNATKEEDRSLRDAAIQALHLLKPAERKERHTGK
jgi:HEAT repeat protein